MQGEQSKKKPTKSKSEMKGGEKLVKNEESGFVVEQSDIRTVLSEEA